MKINTKTRIKWKAVVFLIRKKQEKWKNLFLWLGFIFDFRPLDEKKGPRIKIEIVLYKNPTLK